MLLCCCINLVKLRKFLLSKILGMTYNLERREYTLTPLLLVRGAMAAAVIQVHEQGLVQLPQMVIRP